MWSRSGIGSVWSVAILLLLVCSIVVVTAQDCSASNPCATGCCSKHGYCGTGDDFCGADCVANCDYVEITECDANKPCALGCCSKFGICGFGPDYCSKENCVSSCGQKAQCDPGDWGTEFANGTTCPLNVCCSDYGFCGTTEEFCGNKKVKRPSCTDTDSIKRVVGYYEGWSPRRPCHQFYPEQIDTSVYTHLIYAFATIDPLTFQVLPGSTHEADLMKRLTRLKSQDQGLKVSIAIGGWTFNDAGPTATTFSDLAGSEANQKKFFKSLISFLSTYNFDGVDIDWEYPVSEDRNGRGADFENFPKFMANLKKALKSTGGRDIVSLTLPTSFWYLQHFDIKALEPHVSFFNYMSYDLHGTWDRGNKWTGAFLNAHTNLTEIKDTLDLIWRNKIDPDKIVMGLAFYSRAYTVEDPSCTTPGCKFLSAANPGECSLEAGILLNSELDEIRASRQIKPTLDKRAAVKWFTWDDDQWASYDDAETLQMKIDFAGETCLGGVMVWAVSHDNYNHTYSNALAGLSPIRPKPQVLVEVGGELFTKRTVKDAHRQCKWLGCGDTCSGGYVTVERSDGGGEDGDIMLDHITCPDGVRTLCCPSESVPKCGWYTHNNGHCDPTCPDGMFEIGSVAGADDNLCNFGYQAACCTDEIESTQLYHTLQWSPDCDGDDGTCPVFAGGPKTKALVKAGGGSGDTDCGWLPDGGEWEQVRRQLCYNPNRAQMTWDNCKWKYHEGAVPDGEPDDFCTGRCPDGKIRLAMESDQEECPHGGLGAFCCDDNYYSTTTTTQKNPILGDIEDVLENLTFDGSCEFLDGLELDHRADSFVASTSADPESDSSLSKRDWEYQASFENAFLPEMADIMEAKVRGEALNPLQKKIESGWNGLMKENNWTNLETDAMAETTPGDFLNGKGEYVFVDLSCRPRTNNETRVKEEVEPSACLGDPCEEDADPELCQTEDIELSDSPEILPNPEEGALPETRAAKVYQIFCQSTQTWVGTQTIHARSYPAAGQWDPNSFVYQNAITWEDPDDCGNPRLRAAVKTGKHHDTEHILELQIIAQFLQYATWGRLVSGGQATNFLPCQAILSAAWGGGDILDFYLLPAVAGIFQPGDVADQRPGFRLMNALGSRDNLRDFYLLEKKVNGMKSRVFRNTNLVAPERLKKMIDNTARPGQVLGEIKAAIAVWLYLRDPDIFNSFRNLVAHVRLVLGRIEYEATKPGTLYPFPVAGLQSMWDEWFHDMLDYHVWRTRTWAFDTIDRTKAVWTAMPSTNQQRTKILATLRMLEKWANEIKRTLKRINPLKDFISIPPTTPRPVYLATGMEKLPVEVVRTICVLVRDGNSRDLCSLRLASRACSQVATPVLYEILNVKIIAYPARRAVIPRDPLEALVELTPSGLGHQYLKHTRQLNLVCLTDAFSELDPPPREVSLRIKDMEVNFYGIIPPAARSDFLGSQRDTGILPRSSSERWRWVFNLPEDMNWGPLVSLFGRMQHLRELNWGLRSIFPEELYEGLTRCHPACSLSIWDGSYPLNESNARPSLLTSHPASASPPELDISPSPNLRSFTVLCPTHYMTMIDETLPFTAQHPSLEHLTIQDGEILGQRPGGPDLAAVKQNWQDYTATISVKPQARLRSLTIGRHHLAESLLLRMTEIHDLSRLKSLDLDVWADAGLLKQAAPYLINLERLFISLNPQLNKHPDLAADHPVMVDAILTFNPLQFLSLRGGRSVSALHPILTHHGPTLKGLTLQAANYSSPPFTVPDNGFKYPDLTETDLSLMATSCPNLSELRLPVRRRGGNTGECNIYQALGQEFTRLHTLIVDLHCDPRASGAIGRNVKPTRSDMREIIINAAIDKKLAEAIGNLIFSSQRTRKLRTVSLFPFGEENLPWNEAYVVLLVCSSFLVRRACGSDNAPGQLEVVEVGQRAKELRMDRDILDEDRAIVSRENKDIVNELWPGRGSWRDRWSSFPLTGNSVSGHM